MAMGWKHVGQIVLAVTVLTVWPGPQIGDLIRNRPESVPSQVIVPVVEAGPAPLRPPTPAEWFASVADRCTPAEARIVTDLRAPPPTLEGTAYEAACFALAQDIPMARALLLGLPEQSHTTAAGILFEAARSTHDPAVDAAAGPLMELVLEFWPNHYLALFYAGSARYASGDRDGATQFFERFLELYATQDGWSDNARQMLDTLQAR